MPIHARSAHSFLSGLIAALLICGTAMPPAQARQDGSRTEQAEAKKKLTDLHSKMEALAKQQADTAARRQRDRKSVV